MGANPVGRQRNYRGEESDAPAGEGELQVVP